MKNAFFYDCPIGEIGIAEENGAIIRLGFGNKKEEFKGCEIDEVPLIKKTFQQLTEYFAGRRKKFDLPLNPQGTDFQQSVWETLRTIPFGETCGYKDVAVMVGNPKACRAVGMANNRNPIAIIIPCHRVIGRNGSLTGYAGGLRVKQYLLDLEARYYRD